MKPSILIEKYRSEIKDIFKKYPMIFNVRIAGSVARGEDKEDSDIDFYVDRLTSLLQLGSLHEDLVDLLGVPVDIITISEYLPETMKKNLEQETIVL